MKLVITLLYLSLLLSSANAEEMKIIQIGGGNNIESSQEQIEANVIWLSEILKRSGDDVSNYFASGSGNDKDVSTYRMAREGVSYEAIAKVFDSGDVNQIEYRHNIVPDLVGSMRKEDVVPALERELRGLRDAQDLLLIFNGHGGINSSDVRKNSIKIWKEERLNVADVDEILDAAPENATIRFVFPQCFSGGFYNLIYDTPYSTVMSKQNRCGFFSESAFDEAEGCSLGSNREEYRDYSTYYFAPLNGSTRTDEPLPINPDRNHDGMVSFQESHVYALIVSESKDLSRSTSEMYLEAWEPWYLRWSYGPTDKESIYWRIAEEISTRQGVPLDSSSILEKKQAVAERMARVLEEKERSSVLIEKISQQIRKDAKYLWPELENPYTDAYIRTINTHGRDIVLFLENHEEYADLIQQQEYLHQQEIMLLNLEREESNYDKLMRLKKLARIKWLFDRFASENEIAEYNRLNECEGGTFFQTTLTK
jgi:hypothetical protein